MRFTAVLAGVCIMVACAFGSAFAADSVSASLVEVLKSKGVIDDASYNEIKNAEALGGRSAMDRKLLDVLKAKGILDDATHASLSAQAATAPAAPPAPATAAPSGDRPLESVLAKVEEGFAKLGGDNVKLRIGTWTQLGYVYDDAGSNAGALPGASAVVPDSSNQFYVRFARLYFNGTLAEKIGFRVMFDAAGTPSLRDAFIWFDHIPYTRVTVGQFLTPFGSETWRAPFDLPQINYSFPAQLMQFTNFRDTGVMVANTYKTNIGDRPLGFQLQNCILNGNGINTADDNDHKDWLGRFTVNPLVAGLNLGGSWYMGMTGANSQFDNQRWAAEAEYKPENILKGLLVRAEYMQQRKLFSEEYVPFPAANVNNSSKAFFKRDLKTAVASATSPGPIPAANVKYYHSEGWYVTAAYRVAGLSGAAKYLNDFEPTFRYDTLDEDTANPNDGRDRYTVGLNYWLNKYIRLLNNFEVIHAEGSLKGKSLSRSDQFGHKVFTTNLQIWF